MCACFAWEKLAEDLAERNMLQDVQEHFYITFASVLLNRLRAEKNKEKLRNRTEEPVRRAKPLGTGCDLSGSFGAFQIRLRQYFGG